jgi:lipoprotein-anchoring transpeptidase ErfK/SrfK
MRKITLLFILVTCLIFNSITVFAEEEDSGTPELHNIITLSSEYDEVYVGEKIKVAAAISLADIGMNVKTEWKINDISVPEFSGKMITLQENMQLEFNYVVPSEKDKSEMAVSLFLYDGENQVVSSANMSLKVNNQIPVSIQNNSKEKVYYNQKDIASVKLINKTGRVFNYQLYWKVNGKKIKDYEDTNITIERDATNSTLHANLSDFKEKKVKITFVLDNSINITSLDIQMEVLKYPTEDAYIEKVAEMKKAIKTVEIGCTLVRDSNVYKELYLNSKVAYKKKGSKGVYVNYYGTTSAKVRFSDGTTGWVPYWNISISNENYTNSKGCSNDLKELFANENGYRSDTKYLIWISLKFQQVNAYKGEKGKWKLIRSSMPCSSGKNTTLTISGIFKYSQYQTRWNFGDFYVGPVMRFNGGAAMHSRTYTPDGSLLDPTLGRPASHGCVRMKQEDINWLAKNIQLKTTVVVY